LVCSRDGKTLIVASDFPERLVAWNLAQGRVVREFEGQKIGGAHRLALSPDGRTLAARCASPPIALWDVATGRPLDPLAAPRGFYTARFSPDDGILATGGEDGFVHLWETARWTELRRLKAHPGGAVLALTFSADGKMLATGSEMDRSVRLWDIATGKAVRQFTDPVGRPDRRESNFHSVAFSPDGKLLAASDLIWDVASGRVVYRSPWPVSTIAFAPGGQVMAVASYHAGQGPIRLCEVPTGNVLHEFAAGERFTRCLDFSADGKRLVSCADQRVHVWDAATGKELRRFGGSEGTLMGVALSPDGRMAASASSGYQDSSDGVVQLWEIATGKERRRFSGHRSSVKAVTFSPDGKLLVSAGYRDLTALVWDVTGQPGGGASLAAPLTRDEREALWTDLGGEDAQTAFQAVCALIHRPGQAVAFLGERLIPAAPADPVEVRRLLADLGRDPFAERRRAEERLARPSEQAEAALRQALEEGAPPEVHRRVEELLEKLDEPVSGPRRLRELRGVEVLEHVRSPEARHVLQRLANGAPTARLTQEARAALARGR
jgi:Tol biopolymer transport system component